MSQPTVILPDGREVEVLGRPCAAVEPRVTSAGPDGLVVVGYVVEYRADVGSDDIVLLVGRDLLAAWGAERIFAPPYGDDDLKRAFGEWVAIDGDLSRVAFLRRVDGRYVADAHLVFDDLFHDGTATYEAIVVFRDDEVDARFPSVRLEAGWRGLLRDFDALAREFTEASAGRTYETRIEAFAGDSLDRLGTYSDDRDGTVYTVADARFHLDVYFDEALCEKSLVLTDVGRGSAQA